MKKIAKSTINNIEHPCVHDWPETCYVQCGKKNSTEFFFEAFPKDPNTFIRTVAQTVEEAESKAWRFYQNTLDCKEHTFERYRANTDHAECSQCKLFLSHYFPPLKSCVVCQKPHATLEFEKKTYCIEHYIETCQKLKKLTYEKTLELSYMDQLLITYCLSKLYNIEIYKSRKMFDKNIEEYKQVNQLIDYSEKFNIFIHNTFIEVYKQNFSEKSEVQLTFSFMSYLKDVLAFDQKNYKRFFNYFIDNAKKEDMNNSVYIYIVERYNEYKNIAI